MPFFFALLEISQRIFFAHIFIQKIVYYIFCIYLQYLQTFQLYFSLLLSHFIITSQIQAFFSAKNYIQKSIDFILYFVLVKGVVY